MPTPSSAMSSAETASTIRKLLKEPKRGQSTKERDDASRLDELRRIFAKLISNKELVLPNSNRNTSSSTSSLTTKEEEEDAASKWQTWLCTQHDKFTKQLQDRVRMGRRYALRTYMGVIASSPVIKYDSKAKLSYKCVPTQLLNGMLDALCRRQQVGGKKKKKKMEEEEVVLEMEENMLNMILTEFVSPHVDVVFATLAEISNLAVLYKKEQQKTDDDDDKEEEVQNIVCDNLVRLLEGVRIAENEDDIRGGNFLFDSPPLPPSLVKADDATQDNDDDDDSDVDSEDMGQDSDEESDEDEDESATPLQTKHKRKRNAVLSTQTQKRRKKQKKLKINPMLRHTKHRANLSAAWLSILRLSHLPPRSHKRILSHLPNHVIPHMHNPIRLADYLTHSYNMGGIMSLLALHGLYILMTEHSLEYPKFFNSLYNRITVPAFYAKYRTRFFRLLTQCTSGGNQQMIPAYMVASICKRLCRCALTVPPSGALFVLALVSNLLRRHRECGCLVHRGSQGEEMEDVYDAQVDDAFKSRALESSLWELNALEKHYHPAVAALAKVCGREDDKTPMHNLDDFLLHTYKSLFEQEQNRRNKKAVPLTFSEPDKLFGDGEGEEDVLSAIISF